MLIYLAACPQQYVPSVYQGPDVDLDHALTLLASSAQWMIDQLACSDGRLTNLMSAWPTDIAFCLCRT
jgi:hypothetical protein